MLNRIFGVRFVRMCMVLPFIMLQVMPASANEYTINSADEIEYRAVYDPYEEVNRAIYDFNNVLDEYLLAPVVKTYRFILPAEGRQGVSNMLDNIIAPVTFVNALLQGDFAYAGTTFWRFTINTTLGAAGIMDVASAAGMKERKEDFGQTLGSYGVEPGAYIVLPFLGPSNTRDAGGLVVDAFSNPFIYMVNEYTYAGYRAVDVVDARDGTLDITNEIERTSLDPYAALRSLYMQSRADQVRNGASGKTKQ